MAELVAVSRLRHPAASTLLRRALWPAMLVGGIAAESFLWRGGVSPQYVVYDLGIGFVAAFVTLAVWEAQPRNLVGPLLFVWAAWFVVSPIRFAHVPAVIGGSWLLDAVSGVCFAHAVLSYPTGRLPGQPERVFIAFAYAVVVVVRGSQLLWSPLRDLFGGDLCCQTSPPLFAVNTSIARGLASAQTVTLAVLVVGFIALVVRRLMRARARQRHMLWPVAIVAALFAFRSLAEAALPAHAGGRWDAPDILDHVVTLAVAVVFLLGTYRSRLARADIADLVTQLGGAQPGELQPMLAAALRDRDLRLELDTQIDVESCRTHQVATAIRSATGELLARLYHDQSVGDDPRLLSSVVAATRLALENANLHEQVLARLDEVRASRARLVQASDAERRRLERNLHDGAQQRLLSLGLALQLAQQADAQAGEETKALLGDALSELTAAIAELRELGRGINPAVLTDHGLASAVHTLANRCAVPVRVTAVPTRRLPPDVETAAYYVVAEALQNVTKHADATEITLAVDEQSADLRIAITDNGCGGATVTPGGGLHGLLDRVEAINGTFALQSRRGAGTELIVRLPCALS